jgi:L-threonylcarbamoyladenylate synthase
MLRFRLSGDLFARALHDSVAELRRGGIIAFPTETFYGLGVKFDCHEALKRLHELKRRPREKAMPLIIGVREMLSEIVSLDRLSNTGTLSAATALMDRFWPGPLTLLLPAKAGLSGYLVANTGMVAVRVPGESFALHLAEKAGFPVTATSANPSGLVPAGEADVVARYFGDSIDILIDGGPTPGRLPSTIVDLSGRFPRIVREGAIPRGEIAECIDPASGHLLML